MAALEAIPQLYLFKQNRRSCIGAISNPIEFTEDIRFNSCSELSFKVANKYYDIEQEEWVDNTIYDSIERHRLVYVTDDRDYFKYPVRAIGDSNFYKYVSSPHNRNNHILPYDQNADIYNRNFQVQPETELFDVGVGGGYSFEHFCYIISNPQEGAGVPGDIQDMSYLHWGAAAATYNPMLALGVYVPVEATDIVALYTGGDSSIPSFLWHVAAYEKENASAYVGMWNLSSFGSSRIEVADLLPNGGYVRFWYSNTPNTSGCYYNYDSSTGEGSCGWVYPVSGYAKIFSGKRRCTLIKNSDTNGFTTSKMRWFQITSIDEQDEGLYRAKNVTAYSYEYSLSNTTVSLSASTLPLYIPDAIVNMITGNQWIRDKVNDDTWRSPQKIERGVLNQILDYLPGWRIKYVSSRLMTSYRSLEDVDDVNAYRYLMDTIQSVYNCFIVFDNDEMTISAYSLEDINSLQTPIHLTWDNSIKHFEKTNLDASYFTALRVKAGDNQYGVGLVNPTGNGMIYSFDRILDDLDYCLPDVTSTYRRTLKDAVVSWSNKYNEQVTSSSTYQTNGKALIKANMDAIKAKSEMEIALGNYRSKADIINTFLRDDFDRHELSSSFALIKVPETPWTVQRIKNGIQDGNPISKQFHNATLQQELASAADAYWKAKEIYDNALTSFETATTNLKNIAKLLTMDYSKAFKLNNNNQYAYSSSTTLLSAAEIKELKKYIVEGVWDYENASFSETYDSNDIYSMLSEVLSEARYDLENRLSIANFDFSVDTANISAIPGFSRYRDCLFMAHQLWLHISNNENISPLLLEMHINRKDDNDFKLTFTTDMKRKPVQFRFVDLYSTIAQTSVTDSTFTFDE